MRNDPDLTEYMAMLETLPPPTLKEEVELVKRIRRSDMAARERLIMSNLRLVVAVAKKYPTTELSFLELIYEGNYGLIEAVDHYRLNKGTRFASYAQYWIRQKIGMAIKARARRVHVSERMFTNVAKWRQARRNFEAQYGRTPTSEEIATLIHLPKEKIDLTLRALDAMRSAAPDEIMENQISEENGNNPKNMRNLLADEETGIDRLGETDERKLGYLLKVLKERERNVLILRMGLGGRTPMTLDEIGKQFPGAARTRERIRQIEVDALKKVLAILNR